VWQEVRFPVSNSRHCPFDLYFAGFYVMVSSGAAKAAGGSSHTPKGGDILPITLTFHILRWTVTIHVKSKDRHPGR
jgi:hypothetical protein